MSTESIKNITKTIELKTISSKLDYSKEYKSLSVYTDGACIPNPGEGSYALIILDDETKKPIFKYSNSNSVTTNNQMELSGVISALGFLYNIKVNKITVYSDSTYVVNGSKVKDSCGSRANFELWELFKVVKKKIKAPILFEWVKGHSGNKYNELCDLLAEITLKKLKNDQR